MARTAGCMHTVFTLYCLPKFVLFQYQTSAFWYQACVNQYTWHKKAEVNQGAEGEVRTGPESREQAKV
eukprot:566220-Rhodomonas_salina.5